MWALNHAFLRAHNKPMWYIYIWYLGVSENGLKFFKAAQMDQPQRKFKAISNVLDWTNKNDGRKMSTNMF